MGKDNKMPDPEFFLVTQPDYLDGELIHVGGEDEPLSIQLREEGTIHKCTTDTATAKKLGAYLDGPPVRVFGTATWNRREAGGWQLKTFVIENFMPLENKTLQEALSQFEELPSPDWPVNFGSKE